jgi:hypothetical protein
LGISDVPGSTYIEALGINSKEQLVGVFSDGKATRGFLATPQ